MQLKIGKMTNTEISLWFGIKLNSYKSHRTKKLEELKDYAKFKTYHGGVEIEEIYISTYDYKLNSSKALIKKEFDNNWAVSGLDTCSNVAKKIKQSLHLDIAETTITNYVREFRKEFYGDPLRQTPGTKGSCKYIWCKKIMSNQETEISEYLMFTEEEEQKKQSILTKYYGTAAMCEQMSIVDSMVRDNQISKDEAWDALFDLRNQSKQDLFGGFLTELRQEIGSIIVRGTLIKKEDGLFFKPEDSDELYLIKEDNFAAGPLSNP